MRIILFVNTFPASSETFISNKVKCLSQRNVEVYVFCSDINKALFESLFPSSKNIKIIILKKWKVIPFLIVRPALIIKTILERKNIRKNLFRKYSLYTINKYSPDIVHFEFSGIGVDSLYEIKHLTCKKVVSCRGSAEKVKLLIYKERQENFKILLNEVDAIHCVSDDMRRTILPYCKNPDKIFINYPSIDTQFFKRTTDYDFHEGTINILSIGRLTFQKGFATGLHAIHLLKQSFQNFKWTIVGTGNDYEEILYQCNFLSLHDCVELVGAKSSSEIKELIENADIYLLCSVYEGIANAALEAMSMEVPLVATRSGGMEEVITNGENGMLANVYDHVVLANSLFLLCTDKEMRERIGYNGRKTIIEKFSLETQIDKYIKVYTQLIGTTNKKIIQNSETHKEVKASENRSDEKQKLRIAIILPQFPALSETFFINKVTGLCSRGHNVVVFVSSRSNDKTVAKLYDITKYTNLEIVNLDFKGSLLNLLGAVFSYPAAFIYSFKNGLGTIRSNLHINLCKAYMDKYNCDIYHFGYSGTALFYFKLFDQLKGKTVISCRGTAENVKLVSEKDRVDRLKIIFKKVHSIHCVSNSMSKTIQTYGATEDKIFINHPAVPTVFYKRNKEYLNKAVLTILSVGRLVFHKGFLIGLLAIKDLKDKFPYFVWQIVGDGYDMEELKSHIHFLQIEKNVQLLGKKNRNEIKSLYEEADIYFLPSVSEGLANAALEAMAMGMPVVSSDVGGMSEAITHNIDGKLCSNYDHKEMTEQLYELCTNFELRKRLGLAAKETAKNRFDVDRYISVFEEQYYKLLQ